MHDVQNGILDIPVYSYSLALGLAGTADITRGQEASGVKVYPPNQIQVWSIIEISIGIRVQTEYGVRCA